MHDIKLPELNKRSILDLAQECFNRVKLKTYAVRWIYIGEHVLTKEEITEHIRNSVVSCNKQYCEINVTGLLLVYNGYFVHIVEGSEDTIHRHLRFLFENEQKWIEEMTIKDIEDAKAREEEAKAQELLEEQERKLYRQSSRKSRKSKLVTIKISQLIPLERKWFGQLKFLVVYHSISTLLFDGWSYVFAQPPSLVGTLDLFAPISDHMEQLRICLDKLQKLTDLVKLYGKNLSFNGLIATDPKMEALPEVALLNYLMCSQYTLDLQSVVNMHRSVEDYVFFHEICWPMQHHFTPRQLYNLKIDDTFVDPLPIMPWEIKVKETTEDEEQTETESSD